METLYFFPSCVYRDERPEWVESARVVIDEYLASLEDKDAVYPVCQSGAMFDDRILDLTRHIGVSAANILRDQGFEMRNRRTVLTEIWGQQFQRAGRHDPHVHAYGAQISGFYFIDVPEGSALPMITDPRPGKRQINLEVRASDDISYASDNIVFKVVPGTLLLMNSWLPHAFTIHNSDEPLKFIHFNLGIIDAEAPIGSCAPLAEVI